MSLPLRDIEPIHQFYMTLMLFQVRWHLFAYLQLFCWSTSCARGWIYAFSVLRTYYFTCYKWTEMCGRGLIWAHSSAVRELAPFRKEKHGPLTVMKLHILFSCFKVLVESGLLKLRAFEILTTGCSHRWLSINVLKIGNPQLQNVPFEMGSLSILLITKPYSWMIELFFIEKNSPG